MAVTISSVRIKSFTFTADDETGVPKMSGTYQLVSNSGRILAEQTFNGYNGVKVETNGDTLKAAIALTEAVSANINKTLGFED